MELRGLSSSASVRPEGHVLQEQVVGVALDLMRRVAVGVPVEGLLALGAAVHRLGEAVVADESPPLALLVRPLEHLVLLKVINEGDILQLGDQQPCLVDVHRGF